MTGQKFTFFYLDGNTVLVKKDEVVYLATAGEYFLRGILNAQALPCYCITDI